MCECIGEIDYELPKRKQFQPTPLNSSEDWTTYKKNLTDRRKHKNPPHRQEVNGFYADQDFWESDDI